MSTFNSWFERHGTGSYGLELTDSLRFLGGAVGERYTKPREKEKRRLSKHPSPPAISYHCSKKLHSKCAKLNCTCTCGHGL